MAEEAPNAALSGNRKTSMLSRISQGAAVIVQGPHGKKMERQATDMFKAIDKDGDGTITKEEFAPFYEKMREQARREAEMQERSVTKISKLQHRSRGQNPVASAVDSSRGCSRRVPCSRSPPPTEEAVSGSPTKSRRGLNLPFRF